MIINHSISIFTFFLSSRCTYTYNREDKGNLFLRHFPLRVERMNSTPRFILLQERTNSLEVKLTSLVYVFVCTKTLHTFIKLAKQHVDVRSVAGHSVQPLRGETLVLYELYTFLHEERNAVGTLQ